MTQGQITENTERCKIIKNVIDTYKPNTVLEIGTWKGMGSTKRIVDAIIKSNYAVEGALSDNRFELMFSSDERHGITSNGSVTSVTYCWRLYAIQNFVFSHPCFRNHQN